MGPMVRFVLRLLGVSLALLLAGFLVWFALPSERSVAILLWVAGVASGLLGVFMGIKLRRRRLG